MEKVREREEIGFVIITSVFNSWKR